MILTIEVQITRPPSSLSDALYKTLDLEEILEFITTMLERGYPGYCIRVNGDETP